MTIALLAAVNWLILGTVAFWLAREWRATAHEWRAIRNAWQELEAQRQALRGRRT